MRRDEPSLCFFWASSHPAPQGFSMHTVDASVSLCLVAGSNEVSRPQQSFAEEELRQQSPAQNQGQQPSDSASRASPFCSSSTASLLDALSNCLLASPAPQQNWEVASVVRNSDCELPTQDKGKATALPETVPQRSPSMGGACQASLNPSLTMSPLGPNSLGPGSGPTTGACEHMVAGLHA